MNDKIAWVLEYYSSHPYEFVVDILQAKPSSQQEQILRAIPKAIKDRKGIAVKSGHGVGKCLGKDTEVLMFDGRVKKVEDIKINELLMGPDNLPRIVISLGTGFEQMYRIEYYDGTYYDVNEEHILSLVASQTHGKQKRGDIINISMRNYLKWSDRKKRTNIGYKVSIEYSKKKLKIEPYILGIWLGDGHSNSSALTSIDNDIIDIWKEETNKRKLFIRKDEDIVYCMTGKRKIKNNFLLDLQYYNLRKNKHIPFEYKISSKEQRLQLLAGLIDTDGSLNKSGRVFSITQKNEILSKDILRLVQSVGCHGVMKKVRKYCYYKGKKREGDYYRIHITRNVEQIPIILERKKAKIIKNPQRNNLHYGFKVKKLNIDKYYGFEIDKDGLFVLGDYTVTHNTCLAAWIIHWFMSTNYNLKIPCTAPTQHQLHDVLWSELKKWHLKNKFGHEFEWTATTFYNKKRAELCRAVARTSNKPEGMQGFHAENLMFIADEACHDKKTQILTENGWKLFEDLNKNEKVLTSNDNGDVKWDVPLYYHKFKYHGEMYKLKRRGIDMLITPNHELLFKTQKIDYYKKKKVKDLKNTDIYLPRTINWKGKKCKDVNLLKFYAWFISEGSFKKVNGINYSVVISQYNKEHRKEIIDLFYKLGFKPKFSRHDIYVNSRKFSQQIEECGSGFINKKIPKWIKELDIKYLNIFLDTFIKGDGYKRINRDICYTSSIQLADDLQEIILKTNKNSVLTKRNIKGQKKWIKNHWATSSCDGYVITRTFNNTHAKVYPKMISKLNYNGYVYCVTVPYGNILTRRNGYAIWSGNSGVPVEIHEVIEGSQTQEGSIYIMFANPTQLAGGFFDAFHSKRPFYECFTLSTLDTAAERPDIADPNYGPKIAAKYGEDSDVYRVRVLGEFPLAESNSLIGLDMIEKAVIREIPFEPYEVVEIGVDVARFGDDETTIWSRIGKKIKKEKILHKRDTMYVSGEVAIIAKKYHDTKTVYINVDDSGVGGGVTDRLKELCDEGVLKATVNGVNNGSRAFISDLYINLGTEMWFFMKEWLKTGNIENDEDLIAQLSTRRYKLSSTGKNQLERKEEMKNRGLVSPDRADGAILTLYSLMHAPSKESNRSYVC